jgi:hypothetical protein
MTEDFGQNDTVLTAPQPYISIRVLVTDEIQFYEMKKPEYFDVIMLSIAYIIRSRIQAFLLTNKKIDITYADFLRLIPAKPSKAEPNNQAAAGTGTAEASTPK